MIRENHLHAISKMTVVVKGAADLVWSAQDGMLVLRSRDREAWDPVAREICM